MGFWQLCDSRETFLMKISFFLNFSFFKRFSAEQDCFWLFPVGEKVVLEPYAYPFGIFWHCKIDEISTMVFFLHIQKTFKFLNPERGAALGSSRLVQ